MNISMIIIIILAGGFLLSLFMPITGFTIITLIGFVLFIYPGIYSFPRIIDKDNKNPMIHISIGKINISQTRLASMIIILSGITGILSGITGLVYFFGAAILLLAIGVALLTGGAGGGEFIDI